ncbi:MAG: HEAT repeat domain-containing protein [Planctomycetota bacterium]
MFGSRQVLAFLLVSGLAAGVRADDHARFQRLAKKFRAVNAEDMGFAPPKALRLELLKRIASIGTDEAYQFLADVSRSARQADLTSDVLALIAAAGPRSGVAAAVFRNHLKPNDPHRLMARDFLLERAVLRRDDDWLLGVFSHGPIEDRFLAVRAMGRIRSTHTMRCGWALLRDKSWKPVPGSAAACGTIARAVENMEGPPAARLLLMLQRDARFTRADRGVLRDATRLWTRSNLHSYVALTALAARDQDARVEAARFFGDAGIEAARAPLLALARDTRAPEAERAAAAEALGGLRIARGDLVRCLARLLDDDNIRVRRAAVRGLGRLRVRRAVRTLVALFGTPLAKDAREALAAAFSLEPQHDWQAWLDSPACRLPEGS